MAEDAGALSDMTPQPAANPDAQTTVNDFLDYTEFFPSDLLRSLRLIGDLDQTYVDATQTVHDLTVSYGKLPTIPANERPDPTVLRKEISAALDKAIYCRESTFAEASRLYEVAERHCQRISIIKKKLQALPQPPSRDPTPAPVSPQASRSLNRAFDRTPHLRLTFDGGRHGASSSARARDRKKSGIPLHGARIRSPSSSDGSDAESVGSIGLGVTPKRLKLLKDKTPKTPKSRARVPGSGTNVHSSIAGISTSNALARLSPPPADARPGSKWAPWFKLTEYEMAVLRKQMKKNAVWTPSETMIKRQLEIKGRGQSFYDKEKARCEATGEEFLDEEPVAPSSKSAAPASVPAASAPVPAPTPAPTPAPVAASVTAPAIATTAIATELPRASTPIETTHTPIEPPIDIEQDEQPTPSIEEPSSPKDPKKSKRETQRQQAMRDAQELENATRKIKEAADSLQGLYLPNARRRSSVKSNKRKRDSSPPPTAETPAAMTREPSLASQDSGAKQPERKRLRLQPLAPAPAVASTPSATTPVNPSPIAKTPAILPDVQATTVQIPLAPAGPSTPKTAAKPPSKAASRHATPAVTSPIILSPAEPQDSAAASTSTQAQSTVTAASTRPRRESVAPKAATPPEAPAQAAKPQKNQTPAQEAVPPTPAQPTRPRSARGHVPTPKAQSEEPKPLEPEKPARELRRHSIFSQSAINAPTRTSNRKKPPPKGDISAGADGQKTVTNVKRAQGNKNKKKKKTDEESEPLEEIDPNEPRYCICDDVSYGQMISCDNNCEKEWFHMECVGMTDKDIPSRRAKWYCPDCREQLGFDAYGNPKVPPPLPGRRGNR